MQKFFKVEITDTFSGDANYAWVTRHKVRASTMRGAIVKISRDSGLRFKKVSTGELTRYNCKNVPVCAFVEEWNDEYHSKENHSLNLAN